MTPEPHPGRPHKDRGRARHHLLLCVFVCGALELQKGLSHCQACPPLLLEIADGLAVDLVEALHPQLRLDESLLKALLLRLHEPKEVQNANLQGGGGPKGREDEGGGEITTN